MLLSDAVNEVTANAKSINITVLLEANKLTLSDDTLVDSQFFTEGDPDLLQKVRAFWTAFLEKQSKILLDKIDKNIVAIPLPISITEIHTEN